MLLVFQTRVFAANASYSAMICPQAQAKYLGAPPSTLINIGLSSNPIQPGFCVARYMQQRGYRIITINPNEAEVLGENDLSNCKYFKAEWGFR